MNGRRIQAMGAAAAALAVAAAGVGGAAAGDPDAARIAQMGRASQGVPACASCHGPQGQGVDAQGGPRLARLDAGYLERQLEAFATDQRRSHAMSPIAKRLTPAQRAALAAYFAGLPAVPWSPPVDAARLARGRQLALEGDWSAKAPPCAACHGAQGQGVGSLTPPLVGQSQDYLLGQMTAFRDGDRSGPLGLMAGIARRLSKSDLRAAAAYYASLPAPNTSSAPAEAQP
jgi:thiosulfate dehydrogenase